MAWKISNIPCIIRYPYDFEVRYWTRNSRKKFNFSHGKVEFGTLFAIG